MFHVGVPLAETEASTRRFVRVNRAFCTLVGRRERELIGLRTDDLIHRDDRDSDRELQAACLEGGGDRWRSEVRFVLPDGSLRWVQVRGAVIQGDEGPPTAILLAEDVTVRKDTEERLQASEDLLHAAHELSLQAFVSLRAVRGADGAITDFEWTYVNPAAGQILRHPPPALLGRRLLEVQPGNREAGLFDLYARVVETGEPSERDIWYGADGIEGWFRNSAVKLGDGVAVSFWDITEHKRAEDQRERLYREACAASRAKDEFLATLSHELRTPLNAIVGWAQLLLGSNDAHTRQRGLEAIARNAAAQTRLIEDILDVSRMVAGRLTLDVSPVDVSPVVQAAVEAVRPTAEGKGLTLSVRYKAHPRVQADPPRLQQVFWNLLANAVKFTEAGAVQVVVDEEGDQARVDVLDTGIGIAGEFLPHVFDRFAQADGSSTRAYGGLGLGLAIVRHLVEAHGGTVSVASEGPGQGSVFTVRLPRDVNSPMLPF
jgi:two-component system CheB/CheR fusion protein